MSHVITSCDSVFDAWRWLKRLLSLTRLHTLSPAAVSVTPFIFNFGCIKWQLAFRLNKTPRSNQVKFILKDVNSIGLQVLGWSSYNYSQNNDNAKDGKSVHSTVAKIVRGNWQESNAFGGVVPTNFWPWEAIVHAHPRCRRVWRHIGSCGRQRTCLWCYWFHFSSYYVVRHRRTRTITLHHSLPLTLTSAFTDALKAVLYAAVGAGSVLPCSGLLSFP